MGRGNVVRRFASRIVSWSGIASGQRTQGVWQRGDVLALAVLGLVLVRLAIGAAQGVDLNFGDDAKYMERGFTLNLQNLPVGPEWAVWGPLYQLWFRLLWNLSHHPVVVYYTTILTIGALLPLLLYLLARRSGVAWAPAFLVAWMYAQSYALWLAEPRVSLFAALVMLLGWLGLTYLPSFGQRVWAATLLAVLVAYIRPEYLMAVVIFALVGLGWLALRFKERGFRTLRFGRGFWALSAATALAMALMAWWSPPFQPWRTVYAFGQHYAYNLNFCLKAQVDKTLHWEDLLARDFGQPKTILDAARINPPAFGRHVLCNVKNSVKVMGKALLIHIPFRKGQRFPEALALGGLLMLGVLYALARPQGRTRFRRRLTTETVAMAFIWMLPVLVSTLLIYPREHYLAQIVPVLWLLYAYLIGPEEGRAAGTRWGWPLWIAIVLLGLLTPPFHHFFRKQPQRPRLEAVAALYMVPGQDELRIAGTRGSGYFRIGPYLYPRPYTALPLKDWDEPLADFLQRVRPDVLVVSQGGREFHGDPGWRALQSSPEQFGYRMLVLPSGDAWGPWRLFLRRDLWAAP